jgi:hypothetical protein
MCTAVDYTSVKACQELTDQRPCQLSIPDFRSSLFSNPGALHYRERISGAVGICGLGLAILGLAIIAIGLAVFVLALEQ